MNKQDKKDYNLPFSTPNHHHNNNQQSFHSGTISCRDNNNNNNHQNYSIDKDMKYFTPSSIQSSSNNYKQKQDECIQQNQQNQSRLIKMNSCYFQDNQNNNISGIDNKENKPHLISSATANESEFFKKSYSRLTSTQQQQQQPIPYNPIKNNNNNNYSGKENNLHPHSLYKQQQNNDQSSQYYLPNCSNNELESRNNNNHCKRLIDFSQNSYNNNNNNQQKNNNQQNEVKETVKVKQYLLSQQNSLSKEPYSNHNILSQRDVNISNISNHHNNNNNILGDISNIQYQEQSSQLQQQQQSDLPIKKYTTSSSFVSTPKMSQQQQQDGINNTNINNIEQKQFKSDQFNESLNRIYRLKDKYSYVDSNNSRRGSGIITPQQQQQLQNDVSQDIHEMSINQNISSIGQKLNEEGLLMKQLILRTNSSLNNNIQNKINNPFENNNNNNNSNQYNTGQDYKRNNVFYDNEQSISHNISSQDINYRDRSKSPFINQSYHSQQQQQQQQHQQHQQKQLQQSQSSINIIGNQKYKIEVEKYKQYFIESAIQSERLTREQDSLKDENEKLRFRLKELLRISKIQTENLQAKHNTSSYQIESSHTFPHDSSLLVVGGDKPQSTQITSHSSLQQQSQQQNNQQQLQNKGNNQECKNRQKSSQSYYLNNESIDMKKELEECVLLLESGRQKIDCLKISIQEKESLIQQSKEYTSHLEAKVQGYEKENNELKKENTELKKENNELKKENNENKTIIEIMKRYKTQSINLIEQISNDGYQEHLRESILKQFNLSFVQFLETSKKQMLDVQKENRENLEEIGQIIFKLNNDYENKTINNKKTNMDQNGYRIQLIRHTKEEILKLKLLLFKKLNLKSNNGCGGVDVDQDEDELLITRNNKNKNNFFEDDNYDDERIRSQKKMNEQQQQQDQFQLILDKNKGNQQNQNNLQQQQINSNKPSLGGGYVGEQQKNRWNQNNINNNSNNKQNILNDHDDFLQMIFIQAQSLENVFKDQL